MPLSDLLTSTRGPGVIGTVLALIVLLGFGSLMILVSDNSEGSGLPAKVKEKESHVQSLESQVAHWKKAAVVYKENRAKLGEIEDTRGKIARARSRITVAKEARRQAELKFRKLDGQFESYKKQYRLAERARAVGEEIPVLKTKDGKTYEGVKIRRVTALEIRFSHKSGITGVHYKNLPDVLRDRFQFSEADASAAAKVERKMIERSVVGGERYRITKKILDLRAKISRNNEYISKWSAQIRRSQSEIVSNTSAAKAARERASHYRSLSTKGHRGLTMDNAKKQERKARSLRRKIAAARVSISSNRGKIGQAKNRNRGHEAEIAELQRELDKLKK